MTNGTPPAGPLRRGLQTGRLEALSDGVYAIAITLLVRRWRRFPAFHIPRRTGS